MPVRIETARNSRFDSTHIISRLKNEHLMTLRRWFRDQDDPDSGFNPYDTYTASWSIPDISECLGILLASRDVDWESILDYCGKGRDMLEMDEYADGITVFYPPEELSPPSPGWNSPNRIATGARLYCSDTIWEVGKVYDPEDERFFQNSAGVLRVRSSVDLTAELVGLYASTAIRTPDHSVIPELQYQMCNLLKTFPRLDRHFRQTALSVS